MEQKEILEKLREAMNLGDAPIKGLFGTHIRKEYLSCAVEEIERLQAEVDRLNKENFWLSGGAR